MDAILRDGVGFVRIPNADITVAPDGDAPFSRVEPEDLCRVRTCGRHKLLQVKLPATLQTNKFHVKCSIVGSYHLSFTRINTELNYTVLKELYTVVKELLWQMAIFEANNCFIHICQC